MRIKQVYIILFSIFCGIMFLLPLEVNAMNTGFSTEEVSRQHQITFMSNIDMKLVTTMPKKKSILCFNVNDKGLIAIGQNGSYGRNSKNVCIYSSDGTFLYRYVFKCIGSFYVEWDCDNINIFFVRSDIIISLDPDGNLLDMKKIQDTFENTKYRNSLGHLTSQIVGDTTYTIKNDLGILNLIVPSYSQLIVKDGTGTETIIYDVNTMQVLKIIALIIFFLVTNVVTVVEINRKKKSSKKQ